MIISKNRIVMFVLSIGRVLLIFTLLNACIEIPLCASGPTDYSYRDQAPYGVNVWLETGKLFQCSIVQNSFSFIIDKTGKSNKVPQPPIRIFDMNGDFKYPSIQAVGEGIYCIYSRPLKVINSSNVEDIIYDVCVIKFNELTWKWDTDSVDNFRYQKYFRLFLISRNYLIGITMEPKAFQQDGKYFPIIVFRRDDQGSFKFDRFEDLGLNEPSISQNGEWNYDFLEDLWLKALPSICGSHFVLSYPGGLFWTFDAKGKCTKFSKLYNFYDNEYLKHKVPWLGGILGFEPTPSGDLLISALSDDAALRGLVELNLSQPVQSPEEYMEKEKLINGDIFAATASVNWFTLDPVEGRLYEVNPPVNAPRLIRSHREFMDYNWVLKPDGCIRILSNKAICNSDDVGENSVPRAIKNATDKSTCKANTKLNNN